MEELVNLHTEAGNQVSWRIDFEEQKYDVQKLLKLTKALVLTFDARQTCRTPIISSYVFFTLKRGGLYQVLSPSLKFNHQDPSP